MNVIPFQSESTTQTPSHLRAAPAQLTQDQILRLPLVMALTGLSKSSIYAAMSQKRFPMSLALGVRAVGWKRNDVMNWLETRKPSNLKEVA